jgi:hypothetical protein
VHFIVPVSAMHKLKTVFNTAETQQDTFNTQQGALKTQLATQRTTGTPNLIATQGKLNCVSIPSCTGIVAANLDIDSDPASVSILLNR